MAVFASAPWRRSLTFNRWDMAALPLVISLVALVAWGSRQMSQPYTPSAQIGISLAPLHLPEYAVRSVLRMAIALVLSLVFTLAYGAAAAKSRRAEKVLVPVLDILQSVPILGFLSITVVLFMALAPGNLLGVEMASIFAIFTSQAWNMTFSFYQSLKTVPKDLAEASDLFGLSPWQRFWRLEVPFATPALIWNTMMSVSGGWFFVVASEAIAVGDKRVSLPGIGSYVARAIEEKDLGAIGWALLTMFLVILIYDQLFFRPAVAWAEKFRLGDTAPQQPPRSWVLDLYRHTRFLQALAGAPAGLYQRYRDRRPPRAVAVGPPPQPSPFRHAVARAAGVTALVALAVATAWGFWRLVAFIWDSEPASEIPHVFALGSYTMLRVVILTIVAALIWVPVGVAIGLNAKLAVRVQPLAQFLAAFPANLLFPLAVIILVRYDLNPEVWTAPLMILGTQWYILFNVIAGAAAIPNDLREAMRTMGVPFLLRWRRLYLPGILPYLATGLITAAGGTWNASIVAEVVSWGNDKLTATGLGSYIAEATSKEDYGKIVLGIAVMSIYVVTVNRLLWRRLFTLAERKYRFD